ncbi:MAG: uracil-DNA glycosylase [Gammaproteobacteria bacterium]
MDEVRRLQYLQAIGVDVWLPIAGRLHGDAIRAAAALAACSNVSHPDPVAAMDWETLQQIVAQCRNCGLCEARTQAVFGCGNRQAEWMLIGEAPGQQEDLQGEPFVGRAGQLLTEMLRAMGLMREIVYIANVVKCRPPNNRDPEPDEMAACSVYLRRQIELVRPKIILAVGRIAAQHLLQTDAPLSKLRGKVHFLDEIPLIVIYHPAYLLRSLSEKRKAWDDLQMALRFFRQSC